MKLIREKIFGDRDVFYRYNSGQQLMRYGHDHDFYELFLVTDGPVRHEKNGAEEMFLTGDLVLIKSTDFHCFPGNQTAQILNIAFTASLYTSLLELFGTGIKVFAVKPEQERYAGYLSKFHELVSGEHMDTEDIVLKIILVDMFSLFVEPRQKSDSKEPQWFHDFVKRISQSKVFTGEIDSIYKETDRTPEHIARTFRKYRGMTLSEYVLDLKMQYARNLLTRSNKPILDICFETGFHNLSYFYRCFKRKYGMTPQFCRQHCSEEL